MEAVFAKEVRGLFSSPATPKSFYHPSVPKNPSKKTADSAVPPGTCATTLDKAHLQKANTLTTFPPSLIITSPSSSPPHSAPVWDLRQSPPPHGVREGDVSSGGSSKFNESWPSMSDQGGVSSGVKVGTGVGEEMDCNISKTSSQHSTLARYIDRFRHAPPTSRGSRGAPGESFWWTGEGRKRGVAGTLPVGPVGASTPTSDKSHTHTDPSPMVSSEASLDSRSQELLEKCSTLLTSSVDSPPAQKYHNTLRVREDPPQSTSPQATSGCVARGSGFRQQQDTEDILVQWRLRRKLEQARHTLHITPCPPEPRSGRSIQVELHPSGPESGRGDGKMGSSQSFHPAPDTSKQCDIPTSHPCLATPPPWVCYTGAMCCHHHHVTATPTSVATVLRHVPPGDSGRGQQEVKEQEVQTSPDLLDRNDVQQHEGEDSQTRESPATAGKGSPVQPASAPPTTAQAGHNTSHLTDDEYLTSSLTLHSREHRPTDFGSSVRGGSPLHDSLQLPSVAQRSPGTTPHPVSTLPTHGGLALRDISDDEDTLFTMTFDTELDLSRANTGNHSTSTTVLGRHHTTTPASCQQARRPHVSTPANPHRHDSDEEGFPSPLLPVIPPPLQSPPPPPSGVVACTSEERSTPLLKGSDPQPPLTGFPWDQDMDDDLLKLLITKARLFEGQIREIDCRLMALQEEQQ